MDWGLSQYKILGALILDHLTPYLIIALNCIIASASRASLGKLFKYYCTPKTTTKDARPKKSRQPPQTNQLQSVKIVFNELVSTVELCADCAELNVIYEKHGSIVYGLILLILTYLWMSSFEDALTSPGYMAEELLRQSNKWLPFGGVENYGRLLAQLLAAPLGWRLASFYWSFNFVKEHSELLDVEKCKSSLTTSTLVGMIVELICSMVCRLAELLGHRLLERRRLKQTTLNWSLSFISTALVLAALEKSGGYFNPILASSLEFGCKGASFTQHATVFWLGPMLGHLGARFLFRELLEKPQLTINNEVQNGSADSETRRITRSINQQKKQHVN